MTHDQSSAEGAVKIRRGKVDSLSLYEITENELDLLEKGSPAPIYLNFGIFALSTASSFLIALLTTPIASDRVFITFVSIVLIGGLFGTILCVLWFRSRTATAQLIKRIKQRIPDDESHEDVSHAHKEPHHRPAMSPLSSGWPR